MIHRNPQLVDVTGLFRFPTNRVPSTPKPDSAAPVSET